MALGDTGGEVGIETAAVVPDGEEELAVLNGAGDLERGGLAMTEGIGGEFADDPQEILYLLIPV